MRHSKKIEISMIFIEFIKNVEKNVTPHGVAHAFTAQFIRASLQRNTHIRLFLIITTFLIKTL